MTEKVPLQDIVERLLEEHSTLPFRRTIDRLPAPPSPAEGAIDDLLTVRAPWPIPDDIADALDDFLATRARAARTAAAHDIPNAGTGSLGRRIAIWRGDLTTLDADLIVNAANSALLGCFIPGHTCIDNAIHRIAGPGLRLDCDRHIRAQGHPEPTGTAVITPGHHLPARFVAHTVGPIVPDRRPTAVHERQLAACVTSILDAAHAQGDIRTVGFCAISTGVFGYPKEPAAMTTLTATRDWLDAHPEAGIRPVFSAFTDTDAAVYHRALTELDR